jgi:hypothetical protein
MTIVHIILLVMLFWVACIPVAIVVGTKSKSMQSYRLRVILYGLLALVSVAAIGFAFLAQEFCGMFLYDSNLDTFNAMTAEQKHGIGMSVGSIEMVFILLLVVTNVLWIVGAWFLLSRPMDKAGPTPNHALEPTATAP